MLRIVGYFSSVALAASIVLVAPSSLVAQETPSQPSNAAMQEMMKLMMPGEGHKFFTPMAGKWRGKMKIINYTDPTAPAMESDTESQSKLILGGRFLQEEASGSVMGMPMQRMSILGYDNVTKKYTLIFFSTTETATNIATGTLDADGKTLTLRGEFIQSNGNEAFKNVIRIDGDTHVFESYRVMPDGRELKAVEQVMTRVK